MKELVMSDEDSSDDELSEEMELKSVKSEKETLSKLIVKLYGDLKIEEERWKRLKKELKSKKRENVESKILEFEANSEKHKTHFFCRKCEYAIALEEKTDHEIVHEYMEAGLI